MGKPFRNLAWAAVAAAFAWYYLTHDPSGQLDLRAALGIVARLAGQPPPG